MGDPQKLYAPSLFYLGLFIGALGLTLYPFSYSFLGSLADIPVAVFLGSYKIKYAIIGSFPSLTHSLATSLVLISLLGLSRRFKFLAILASLSTLLLLERSMGTYDPVDVAALLTGAFIGLIVLLATKQHNQNNNSDSMISAVLIAVASTSLAVGSYSQEPGCARYEGTTCVQQKRFANPVYMSYADLRSAVSLQPAKALTEINRLYLYKSLIFMNQKNQGIHIIDNRFPANPRPIGFIRIPGNLDISIRDDYLYADSYVDLVTLDLSDLTAIKEVSRQEEIFRFDAFQNIPSDIDFKYELIDSTRGVIVGYE